MMKRRIFCKHRQLLCLFYFFVIIISLKLINLTTKQVTRRKINLTWNLDINTTLGTRREAVKNAKSRRHVHQTLISHDTSLIDEYKEPVDLVYLWANGSNPRFILDMKLQKASEEPEKYQRSVRCSRRSKSGEYIHVIVVYPGISQTNFVKEGDNIKLMFNVTDKDMEYTVVVPTQNEQVDGIMNILTEIEGQMYICMCGYITNVKSQQAKKQLRNMYILKSLSLASQKTSLQKLRSLEGLLGFIEQEDVGDKSETYTFVYAKPGIQGDMFIKSMDSLDISNLDLKAAILVWDTDSIEIMGVNKKTNTFEDNDQLRFSLRSVEKHAPWIQHIYIITNEQTPYWLNTSNTRISVVFTKDLLPNKKDLPTFSSPVIESHMHRIPGLSETFLFMCDDFYFGKEVQLQDFYTDKDGFKFRWDGPINFCSPECSHFDLGNGVCNKGCDNVKCGFDHGECRNLKKSDMRIAHPVGLHYGSLYHTMAIFNRKRALFELSRKYLMPPHRPLLVKKQIAKDMEKIFHEDFKKSSSLHFRSQFNIQYTMAYMKFVSSVLVNITTEQIFNQLEESRPGFISYKAFANFVDTVLTAYVGKEAAVIRNVSMKCLGRNNNENNDKLEVPKHLFTRCPVIVDMLTQAKVKKLKYKHTSVTATDSYFIMLYNLRGSQKDLGILKRAPRKFNAINDNLDHTKGEVVVILKVLHNFFMKLFPTLSQFELRTAT